MKYKCQFPDCEEEVVEIAFLLTSHPGELIYELECKGWYAIMSNNNLLILCPEHKRNFP